MRIWTDIKVGFHFLDDLRELVGWVKDIGLSLRLACEVCIGGQ